MFKITVRKYDENHNGVDYLSYETENENVIMDIKDIYGHVNFASWILPVLEQKDYDNFLSEITAETEITIIVEQKLVKTPTLKDVIEVQAELETVPFAIYKPFVKKVEYHLYRNRSDFNWKCMRATVFTYCQGTGDVGVKVNHCIMSNMKIEAGHYVPTYPKDTIVKNKITGTRQLVIGVPKYTGLVWEPHYTLKPIGTYFAEEHDLTEG